MGILTVENGKFLDGYGFPLGHRIRPMRFQTGSLPKEITNEIEAEGVLPLGYVDSRERGWLRMLGVGRYDRKRIK